MATHLGEQTVASNEQVDGPASGGSTSGNVDVRTPAARESAIEPMSSEQTSAQQQQAGPGLKRLFPNTKWEIPYAPSPLEGHPACASICLGPGGTPVRRERIPYVQPIDSPTGIHGDDLGVSSAWGMEGMPAILMYAPERSLLDGAAGSTDASIPDHLVLCVVEDAFERTWVAPQGYWRLHLCLASVHVAKDGKDARDLFGTEFGTPTSW
ncbi:hypothetical protein V8D89_008211 [Ganoderma adspersum]